ncbi:hypothetical protein N405_01435 [Helicobacter pylori FD568]|nr:hypothetical protein N405_01435 [Helicobacter pylori FD568]
MENKEERHVKKFLKSLFQSFMLGCVGFIGVRDYGKSQTLKSFSIWV